MNVLQTRECEQVPKNWLNYFESFFTPMYKEALRLLKLSENNMLLDLSCGPGSFARIAKKTGAEIRTFVPGMYPPGFCGKYDPKNTFVTADLNDLPFEDNSFDVITGFNVFQHIDNSEKLVREAKRVLKDDGLLLISTWDKQEQNDFESIIATTGSPFLSQAFYHSFMLSGEGKVERLLKRTGLQPVYSAKIRSLFSFREICEGVHNYLNTCPAARFMDRAEKMEFEQSIMNGFHQYSLMGNSCSLRNNFLIFVAAKA